MLHNTTVLQLFHCVVRVSLGAVLDAHALFTFRYELNIIDIVFRSAVWSLVLPERIEAV